MLRTLLALLPTLQLGIRLKESINQAVRQAIVVAVALVFLLGAAVFGLVAGYTALQTMMGFSPLEASGIVASGLLLLGMLTLAMLPLVARPKRKSSQSFSAGKMAGSAVTAVDSQLGGVMQRVNPIGVLAAAFVIGILFGRR